jgi:oligopeptide/dipeptide ABC transporter ATP-binding protein
MKVINQQSSHTELISIDNLTKYFFMKKGFFQRDAGNVKAVDGVNLNIQECETLGLVGESGCGKSTLGRTLIGLYPSTRGKVQFQGQQVTSERNPKQQQLKKQMQMIFQDPFSSMNPGIRIQTIVGEPLIVHENLTKKQLRDRVGHLIEMVGLEAACMDRFPHEFSGGQRQRLAIARALALNPKFIVCDEPVSSLDVSVQAQIINLLSRLQKEKKLTYLFISHDLAVVRHISCRIAVMYLGKVVELADRQSIYEKTSHPYTKSLLDAIPLPDPVLERQKNTEILEGDIPSPLNPPTGCRFHTRCRQAEIRKCDRQEPKLTEINPGHWVACHHHS